MHPSPKRWGIFIWIDGVIMKKTILAGVLILISASSIAQSQQKVIESTSMCLYAGSQYTIGSIINDQSGGNLVCMIYGPFASEATNGLKKGDVYWAPKAQPRNIQ